MSPVKSTHSPPDWNGSDCIGRLVIGRIPDRPSDKFFQTVSRSQPIGLTTPRPVMTTRGFVIPVMVFYRIKVQMGRRTGGLWFGLPSLSEPSDYDNLGEFYWRQLFVIRWPSCNCPRVNCGQVAPQLAGVPRGVAERLHHQKQLDSIAPATEGVEVLLSRV